MIDINDIQMDDLPEEFRAVARLIGMPAALALVNGFAGCQLYVPKLETLTRQQKHRRMYDDFQENGNYKRVAVKYGLSESRTRQIVNGERRRRLPIRETQNELF
nr:Mor transcription activator family protein [uncultured Desulfobacter sp.]